MCGLYSTFMVLLNLVMQEKQTSKFCQDVLAGQLCLGNSVGALKFILAYSLRNKCVINFFLKERQLQQFSGEEAGVRGRGVIRQKQFVFKSLTHQVKMFWLMYYQLLVTDLSLFLSTERQKYIAVARISPSCFLAWEVLHLSSAMLMAIKSASLLAR